MALVAHIISDIGRFRVYVSLVGVSKLIDVVMYTVCMRLLMLVCHATNDVSVLKPIVNAGLLAFIDNLDDGRRLLLMMKMSSLSV